MAIFEYNGKKYNIPEDKISDFLQTFPTAILLDNNSKEKKAKVEKSYSAYIRVDYPKDKTIAQMFELQVDKTPDNIAVVYEDKRMTYAQLDRAANRMANYLMVKYQVKPDDLVMLCLDRSEWMMVAIMAVLKAGAAYVPVSPDYPKDRIDFMLEDTKAKVVLTNEKYKEIFNSIEQPEIEFVDSSGMAEKLQASSPLRPETETKAENLAYVIYTSGTTGRPKGVMVEHRGVINLIEYYKLFFNKGEELNTYSLTNYVFDVWVAEYSLTLFTGGIIEIGNPNFSDLDLSSMGDRI